VSVRFVDDMIFVNPEVKKAADAIKKELEIQKKIWLEKEKMKNGVKMFEKEKMKNGIIVGTPGPGKMCNNFHFVLKVRHRVGYKLVNRLYGKGCTSVVIRGGVTYLYFDRSGVSRESAIKSAVRDVRECGLSIMRKK
jgi:hypothetical protein